ncbi:MAG: hypothetical protein DWQ29_18395 [Planctomycetota bacterium]|nr:MAG: hypothetical protein DWQ29_18395 [Planctomycetota bacterium]
MFLAAAGAGLSGQSTDDGPRDLASMGPLRFAALMQQHGIPLQQKLAAAFEADDLDAAQAVCEELIGTLPFHPDGYYNLACVHARRGETDQAYSRLTEAVEHGFRNVEHMRSDSDLAPLRDDERYAELLKQAAQVKPVGPARKIQPADVVKGVATVDDGNTAIDPRNGLFVPLFNLPAEQDRDAEITTFEGPAGDLVREWWKDGTAAGFAGDLYDNRDQDHSTLQRKLFPLLTQVEYGPDAKALGLHQGVPRQILHRGVVLGNASLAMTAGPLWRSMPRLAMSDPRTIGLLHVQYSNNQLYVYPCHVDYSPGRNGKLGDKNGRHGDVYFANTPLLITSQGSSYTDQPFLEALALTMAAFRPETKQFLVERMALSPTLQMIFRRSNKPVESDEDYLSGTAHPPVFPGEDVDAERMVRLAHGLTPETVPPVVALRVVEEEEFVQGRDYFDPVPGEQIFDTPAAIARVMRATARTRTMVVSAAGTRALSGEVVEYQWSLLQGDRERVEIRPMEDDGSRVELTVGWHDRFPAATNPELGTNRVDIACFARSGEQWSAPAFVTFYCPDNEERSYDEEGRIREVRYNDNYADPVLVNVKEWRDEYQYDEDGHLTGWTRHRGDSVQEFTPEGQRIIKRDDDGTVVESTAVEYKPEAADPKQRPRLVQTDVASEKSGQE